MFRLDNILEQWAKDYKLVAHDPDVKHNHRAFFRCEVDYRSDEWIKNLPLVSSPSVGYCTQVDGMVQGSTISYQHRILFMVKQNLGGMTTTQAQRDNDATECKVLGNDMALDCLAFLSLLKKAAMNNFHGLTHEQAGFVLPYHQKFDIAPCAGLQIESANWATIPKMYNAWWVCELNIVQLVQRPLCVENAKYNL